MRPVGMELIEGIEIDWHEFNQVLLYAYIVPPNILDKKHIADSR